MEYTYYKPVKSNEHMLYASEIADMYGILTTNNNPATRFIAAIIEDYIRRYKIEYEQLYYLTIRGFMTKVYSKEIYHAAMVKFAEELFKEYGNSIDEHDVLTKTIKNTTYSFKIRKRKEGE